MWKGSTNTRKAALATWDFYLESGPCPKGLEENVLFLPHKKELKN